MGLSFEFLNKALWWFDYFLIFQIMAICLSFLFKNEFTMITICGLSIAGMQALHLKVIEDVYNDMMGTHENSLANQVYLLSSTNIL